jgi:gamma-glutamyltranspeptidase
VVGGDTGVLLHNRGSYFSLDQRHVNYLQPGKRTMHTLTPAMVLRDEKPYMAIGTMGGDAQPQIHVQLLTAMLDFGMNPQQAIAAPRWRSGRMRLYPPVRGNTHLPGQRAVDELAERDIAEVVVMEKRFGNGAPLLLEMLGHRIQFEEPWGDGMGHAQTIRIHRDPDLFEGAADPRCDGLALGW